MISCLFVKSVSGPMFKCTVNRTFDPANPEYGHTRRQFFLGLHRTLFWSTISTKNYKKTLAGPFLGKPLKMHCKESQCTAM